MASNLTSEHSYILLESTRGMKTRTNRRGTLKYKSVFRGELLTSMSLEDVVVYHGLAEEPAHNFRSKRDPRVTLYGGESNEYVAPVSGKELQLLEAIEKTSDRFAVFSEPNKLTWGSSLKKGDEVYVKIPTLSTKVPTWSMALVQYAGPVETLPGWNFGLEIKDYHYLDSGNSDGSFRRNRFFKCKKNCGLYIPLDKLASKPSSPQTTGVSCSNYGSSDSADSKRMGAFFIVKERVRGRYK